MQNKQIIREVLTAAVRTRRAFPRGGPEHLEPNAVQVLLALSLSDRAAVGALADQLALGPSTVSHALDRLRRDGLVETLQSQTDKRAQLQHITADGESAVAQFLAGLTDHEL
jgi:DNA-binding MarR family transcriptional regulator